MSEPKHAAKPKQAPPPSAEGAPAEIYTGGRFGRWIGKLLGGAGKRTGARDTDPGS